MNRHLTDRKQRALALLRLVEKIEDKGCSVHIMPFDESAGASAPVELFYGIAGQLQTPVQVMRFGPIERHSIQYAGVKAYTLGGQEVSAAIDRRV